MAVNNETGAVNDIARLAQFIRAASKTNVHIHCDMVQALGKIPIDAALAAVDSASFAAHKLGGPRGIGLLYLKTALSEPMIFSRGGAQEGGIRSGTENIAGAVEFALAIEKYARAESLQRNYSAASQLMDYIITRLKQNPRTKMIPAVRGDACRGVGGASFSPYILQAAFDGVPGETLVRALDDAGFAVSTGSACHAKDGKRYVLAAMGVDSKTSFEGIRISIGYSTTLGDAEKLCTAIEELLEKM
jgi:cysteine desulfurase